MIDVMDVNSLLTPVKTQTRAIPCHLTSLLVTINMAQVQPETSEPFYCIRLLLAGCATLTTLTA